MNSSDTLKCAQEASQLIEEVSQMMNKIISSEDHDTYVMPTTTCSLGEKLIKIRVYLNELVNELKWRHEVSTIIKREIDRALWLIMGMVLGGVVCAFAIHVRHLAIA